MNVRTLLRRFSAATWLAALLLGFSAPASARPALIAIIIDDLGNQLVAGRRTIALDAPLACAVMPYTAYGKLLASEAHAAGKEVMLHLPMQPMQMNRIAGPGEISLDNGASQLRQILDHNLASVPHAVGVNNHMGSLITRHPGHMHWLMDALAERGNLFFIDSRTTEATVAYTVAREAGLPAASRDVFLDDDPSPAAVAAQFDKLRRQALQRGYAIGIGHPYPATLELLERELPVLAASDAFQVVPVSRIIELLESGVLPSRPAPGLTAANFGSD